MKVLVWINIENVFDGQTGFCNKWELQWTDCIIDKIFQNVEIVKFITTALKSVLKLVKLQSLVAKCCKMRKMQACKVLRTEN